MQMDAVTGQPIIQAERVTLRPLQMSDTGLLDLYAGDERVARGTSSIPHPLPPGASEAFVNSSQSDKRTEDIWAIDGTSAGLGELVGVIGLERMQSGTPNQSEIGYWIAPGLWNTGLASEAVVTLLAANPQKCETVFASVFQDNPGSARVLTNAGFAYVGDAESYSVARAGKVPTWTYLKKLTLPAG